MVEGTDVLVGKWRNILEHPELPKIADSYRKGVTAVVLENQQRDILETKRMLMEAAPTNATGSEIDNYDPILISLVRRAIPQLIAFDVCGVQPMTGPTGLIFALYSRYTNQTGTEALFNEADTDFSGRDAAGDTGSTDAHSGGDPSVLPGTYTTGTGMTTTQGETLGDSTGNDEFAEMAFSIDKVTVTAKTRALKAEYTMELAQDLKAIHGLDAETELANILTSEILAEINREVIRTIYTVAKAGAQINTAAAGTFDLDQDSNGRWMVEKFKGLMFALERDANAVGQQTRRGKGNIILTSADVASALAMSGKLDYAPAMSTDLNVDDTATTFAGVLNGRFKVFVDPYSANVNAAQYYVVGYRGSSAFDAGLFYCPYVPLQMVRAVGENSFQPKIGFKTRYGMVQNPFATSDGTGVIDLSSPAAGDQSVYYRRVKVTNLM